MFSKKKPHVIINLNLLQRYYSELQAEVSNYSCILIQQLVQKENVQVIEERE